MNTVTSEKCTCGTRMNKILIAVFTYKGLIKLNDLIVAQYQRWAHLCFTVPYL